MNAPQTTDNLAAAIRAAILSDLGSMEAFYYRRMEEHRAAGKWQDADQQQRMAELVRGAIVTAQAAATRVLEAT